MASGIRGTRTQYRSVGVTNLKPAFGTKVSSRSECSLTARNKTPAVSEPALTRSNAVEGFLQEKKPLKKSPSESGRKRKDKRHLRERRHGTGVVILPGGSQVGWLYIFTNSRRLCNVTVFSCA